MKAPKILLTATLVLVAIAALRYAGVVEHRNAAPPGEVDTVAPLPQPPLPAAPTATGAVITPASPPSAAFHEPATAVHPLDPAIFDTHAGDRFTLTLPGDRHYPLEVTRVSTHPDGSETWTGRFSGLSPIYRLMLTRNGDFVTGRILAPSGLFRVRSHDGRAEILDLQRAGYRRPAPAGEDFRAPPSRAAAQPATAPATPQSAAGAVATGDAPPTPLSAPVNTSSQTRITLLALYDTEMISRYGSAAGAETQIQYLIDQANQAYRDSQIDIYLTLVHAQAVDYGNLVDNDLALDQLTAGSNSFYDAAALRNQYAADLVAFIRPFHLEQVSCGVAWLYTGPAPDADQYGYAVISEGTDSANGYYCNDYTLAHELGHTLGSTHDRANAGSPGAYSYSYGYGVDGSFGTIMSYLDPAVGYFSNPAVIACNGQACGVDENAANGANNALSHNNTKAAIAAYRASEYLLTLTLSGPGSVEAAFVNPDSAAPESYSCSTSCTVLAPEGVTITLTASADSDKSFWGWGAGDCDSPVDSSLPICQLTLNADRAVTGTFGDRRYRLTVTAASSDGSVLSSPGTIDCGETCSDLFAVGTAVTLTPSPMPGYVFWQWASADNFWGGVGCFAAGPCTFDFGVSGDLSVTALFSRDSDSDGMGDDFEVLYGLDPTNAADSAADDDGDGLSNLEEFQLGTDPSREDSDGDGMPDAWEAGFGLAPARATDAPLDSDQDGVGNYREYLAGTDPTSAASVQIGANLFLRELWATTQSQDHVHNLHFLAPVALSGPPSARDSAPVTAPVDNGDAALGSTQFGFALSTWEATDHATEQVPYLLGESGRWPMADGSIWELGVISATRESGGSWPPGTFRAAFPDTPYLYLVSSSPIARVLSVSPAGFEFTLNEREAAMPSAITTLTLGYLAIYHPDGAPAEGRISEGNLALGSGMTHYRLTRVALSDQAATVLGDTLWLQEETSLDAETRHAPEQVDVLSLNGRLFAQVVSEVETDTVAVRRRGRAPLDLDGDGDADANDGVMAQRRLTGAGTVTSGISLPATVSGNTEVVATIDAVKPELDVDGDGDSDANDGVMIQRRLTGAGTVTTNLVRPAGVGGEEADGAFSNRQILERIDGMKPLD